MVNRNNTRSLELSIVIPAHNEAYRILPYLQSITDYFRRQNRPFEILVVDDGSTDATALIVDNFARSTPALKLLQLPERRGKGAAVRYGMQSASGTLQLFADADGATPIQEITRLEKALAGGADLAIGSRALAAKSGVHTVRVRAHRSVLGILLNSAVRRSGIEGIRDTQCGFKLFRRVIAQELFGYSSINGFGFDLELLYLAQQRGYRIAEVPVNWTDQPGSKVRVFRDGLAMLRELAMIRRNHIMGLYDSSSFSPALVPVSAGRFGLPQR